MNDPATRLGSAAWVGQSIERREDAALLTGAGRFADDLGTRPGTLHAAFLRSPHAHARIKSIDVSRAEAHDGVRCVLVGADVRSWARPFVVGVKQPMEHWCIAVDKVRYVGEPVAVVVAQDRYIAEDALDLIEVDYETIDAVVDIREAALLVPAVNAARACSFWPRSRCMKPSARQAAPTRQWPCG